MTELRRKLAVGATLMVLVRFIDRGLGLISMIVLARFLVPDDFGLVAMATVVIALAELLSTFGFDLALIHKSSADRSHYDTAWTLNALIGAAVCAALLALAYPAAWFYGEPRVAAVLAALSIAPLIQGFENIGVVAFRKDLNFRAEFLWVSGRRLANVLIVLPMAYYLRSYWALVAGIVIGRVLGTALSYAVHPYRPGFSLAAWKDLFSFSKWIVVASGLQFLLQRSPDLIVGRLHGAGALGVYNIAAEIAALPSSELIAPINRVAYPAFAKIASDRTALKREYLAVVGVVALFAVPASLMLSAIAAHLIPLMLGPRWIDAVPLIAVLALFGAAQFPYALSYSVYLAIGKPVYQVALHAIHVPALVVLMIVLSTHFGPPGAAWASAVAGAAMVPISLRLLCRDLGIAVREFMAVMWRPVASAAVMYLSLSWAGALLPPSPSFTTTAAHMVSLAVFGCGVYVGAVLLAWWLSGKPNSAESAVLARAAAVLGRYRLFRKST